MSASTTNEEASGRATTRRRDDDRNIPIMPVVTGCVFFMVLGMAVVMGVLYVPLVYNPQDLSGKTFLVTGCTPNGIGFESAKMLLEWNASRVVCTARDEKKALEVKSLLSKVSKVGGVVDVEILELMKFSSVRQTARSLAMNYPKFDGVLLNAGLMSDNKRITVDGFDEMFQVNHLSQFLLLRLLEARLAPRSRVVFVSSSSYQFEGKLSKKEYGEKPGGRVHSDPHSAQWYTYTDTKLMQVLAANSFARRHPSKDVVFTSVCPGIVKTGFQARMPKASFTEMIGYLVEYFGRTPRQGAMRPVQLLTDPKFANVSGEFFQPYFNFPQSKQVSITNEQWLYDKSSEFVGLK